MMTDLHRPDISRLDPEIQGYIEALEAEVDRLSAAPSQALPAGSPVEPSEPPTSINVISISKNGFAKRTPRHLYVRQRRSGMGVFDLEAAADDYPTLLAVADEDEQLLFFSNFGRAFRMPVNALSESPVRARGVQLSTVLPFRPHERIVAALPENGGSYVALVSQRGWVRRVRSNYLGDSLIPGMTFHDVKEGGYLTAACWTSGNQELVMASRQGKGIRFDETQVPARGCLGMRVSPEDGVTAVTAVGDDSGVFLLGSDGKGTIRLMAGFSANKAPGAGGKVILKTDGLIGAVTVTADDDIFANSQLGKIIRFSASEVPPKEGVVQGVNCITVRADMVMAVAASRTGQ